MEFDEHFDTFALIIKHLFFRKIKKEGKVEFDEANKLFIKQTIFLFHGCLMHLSQTKTLSNRCFIITALSAKLSRRRIFPRSWYSNIRLTNLCAFLLNFCNHRWITFPLVICTGIGVLGLLGYGKYDFLLFFNLRRGLLTES